MNDACVHLQPLVVRDLANKSDELQALMEQMKMVNRSCNARSASDLQPAIVAITVSGTDYAGHTGHPVWRAL